MGFCLFFKKQRKKQVPGTRPETGPDDQTRQEDQDHRPAGHKTSPHKRATTPRATTARTTRNFYYRFHGFDIKGNCCPGQRTGSTSAPLVPLCCLPPAEFGRPMLSEVANSALLPLFPYCRTRVIPMTPLGRSTVSEFFEEKRQRSFTASKGKDETISGGLTLAAFLPSSPLSQPSRTRPCMVLWRSIFHVGVPITRREHTR